MPYVDGYVIPVPLANKDAYVRIAKMAAPIFREHGALSVVECWGDDIPPGKVTSFPRAVQCTDDETVVLAWVTWPSREARDAGNRKVFEDPRMKHDPSDPLSMPFDGKRMIIGGFEVLLEA